MPPKKKSLKSLSQYRPFLWPVLIFSAVFFSFLFILRPRIDEIITAQKVLYSKKEELGRVTQKLAALEGLNEFELSDKVRHVLRVLPSEKNVPYCLAVIRSLAESTDVNLVELGVKPGEIVGYSAQPETDEKYSAPFLAFSIAVSGPQESINKFLDKVKSTAPLMRLQNVAIFLEESPSKTKGTLNIFYLPTPEKLGEVIKPLPKITTEEDEIYASLANLENIPIEFNLTPVESGKENPFAF